MFWGTKFGIHFRRELESCKTKIETKIWNINFKLISAAAMVSVLEGNYPHVSHLGRKKVFYKNVFQFCHGFQFKKKMPYIDHFTDLTQHGLTYFLATIWYKYHGRSRSKRTFFFRIFRTNSSDKEQGLPEYFRFDGTIFLREARFYFSFWDFAAQEI